VDWGRALGLRKDEKNARKGKREEKAKDSVSLLWGKPPKYFGL
jgi:hypothetical protein